jgi:hypothetical protein
MTTFIAYFLYLWYTYDSSLETVYEESMTHCDLNSLCKPKDDTIWACESKGRVRKKKKRETLK